MTRHDRDAAYRAQISALNLKPWEEPPCVVDENDPNERAKDAQKLLRRMLALGISRWHHDPLAAIEAAEQKRRLRGDETPAPFAD
jgi:hypothetical protein